MKMELNGWSRSVVTHRPKVVPVKREPKGYTASTMKPGPIVWHAPLRASARLENLNLTGDFLLDMAFEEAELRSWLLAYAKGSPEQTLRLIAEAQAEALISMFEKPSKP